MGDSRESAASLRRMGEMFSDAAPRSLSLSLLPVRRGREVSSWVYTLSVVRSDNCTNTVSVLAKLAEELLRRLSCALR